MPRIRSVHPDICQSRTMAKLSAELERTFVRLWTHCDDEGRCEDRPKILKAALYPEHDDVTAESLDEELGLLADGGLILRYVVDGSEYIQVVSWDQYQKPQRPRPSKYPPPHLQIADEHASLPASARTGEGEGEGVGEGVGEGDPPPPPTGFKSRAIASDGGGELQSYFEDQGFHPDDIGAALAHVRMRNSAAAAGFGTSINDPVAWMRVALPKMARTRSADPGEAKVIELDDGTRMELIDGQWREVAA